MNNIFASNTSNHIRQFHLDVEQLSAEYPLSLSGEIYQKWVSFTLTPLEDSALQSRIRVLWNKVNKTADAILKQLPNTIKDLKSFHQKFANEPAFKAFLEKRTGVSQEEFLVFYKDMDHLFGQIFPLIANPYSKDNKMSPFIQNYLSPELKQLRLEKISDPKKKYDAEHTTQRKIEKGKLAVALGRGIVPNKGSTGTLIIYDIHGKPVGVHKVSEKDVPWLTRVKNIIKSIFGGQLTYLSKKFLAQPRSERAAFLLSSKLGFNLAPCSLETTIKEIVGVFQIFISRKKENIAIFGNDTPLTKYPKGKGPFDYIEAKHVVEQLDVKKEFTESEKTKFQLFAIFDYVIGNLDRHEENWFVTISPSLEITGIKAIDNAYAFPKKQPRKGSLGTNNQYKWKLRSIAHQTFTQETVAFVRNNLNPEKIFNFIECLKNDLPDFLDLDMEQLLVQRAKVAYLLVQKNSQSPVQLAECSSDEEINVILSRSPFIN